MLKEVLSRSQGSYVLMLEPSVRAAMEATDVLLVGDQARDLKQMRSM